MKLTVIIPAYNEIETIRKIINKIKSTNLNLQIIVIDDYSTDGTREILSKEYYNFIDKLILHEKNLGKGAAIKSAQKFIKGDYVIIQDADLEYDPNDYHIMLDTIIKNKYKVLYGSRVLNKKKYQNLKNFSHAYRIWGNSFLTKLSNIINNQKLTDAHTCYKLFDAELIKNMNLKEKGFSFCPEITTKIANMGEKIHEIPINYNGRTYLEGKKIKTKDGIDAMLKLIKYRFFSKN